MHRGSWVFLDSALDGDEPRILATMRRNSPRQAGSEPVIMPMYSSAAVQFATGTIVPTIEKEDGVNNIIRFN